MKCRKLKIGEHIIPQVVNKPMKIYPEITLKGKWLHEAGFDPSGYVTIAVKLGKLIIEKANS